VLTLVTLYGTLDLAGIVDKQAHYWGWVIGGHHYDILPAWNVFSQPLAFLLFLVCIHAEANRAPFDLAEAEQELVGGYHTEYSSMRFALFFLAEYAGMVTTSAVCVALFFGGWHVPYLEWLWPALGGNVTRADPALTTSLAACIVRAIAFFTKTVIVLFVFLWVRWSLPRFRFDQLMMTAWRALIPMSLALLVVTALLVYFQGWSDPQYGAGKIVSGWFALELLGCNLAVTILTMIVSKLIPAAPLTNRKLKVHGSRFDHTPLPLATNN
jgi:NADH-quinone oxidoreductase subunit H